MKQIIQNTNRGGERSYIVGLITAVMTALFCLMIIAWIMTVKDFSDGVITILSYFTLGISSFIGGWFASRVSKRQGIKNGGMIGASVFAFVFIMGIIMNGFIFQLNSMVKFLVCVLIGMLGGIFGVNKAEKRKIK